LQAHEGRPCAALVGESNLRSIFEPSEGASVAATGRRGRASGRFALIGLIVVACVYDADERCDPGQVLFADTRCICPEGLVLSEQQGCVRCGENEVAGASGCVCADGYGRSNANAPCTPRGSGQGDACDDATPCTTSPYTFCQIMAGSAGYCTDTGCSSSSECTGGYACDATGSPSFCKRPPLGAGKPCTSAADCEDSEATYCDSFASQSCLVQGCALAPDNCFEGTECCDLSAFDVPQPLCVATGECP
jgi:hypothetical protein